MHCRRCDTVIDEDALVCFACGAATREPLRRPGGKVLEWRSRPLWRLWLQIALYLTAVGIGVWRVVTGNPPEVAVWWILGAVGVLLTWRWRRALGGVSSGHAADQASRSASGT